MKMKTMISLLICLTIVAVASFAEEQSKKNRGASKTTSKSAVKEASADDIKRIKAEFANAQITTQYIIKLITINSEIQKEYLNIKHNDRMMNIQYQEEQNEIAYQGGVPNSLEKNRDRISDDKKYSNEKIKKLESEKEDLKLDAVKYFKGELPPEFSTRWNETESKHWDAVNKIMNEQ